jgi:ABC-type dipeptide/oligopeptide/nickel transport system permease subunit
VPPPSPSWACTWCPAASRRPSSASTDIATAFPYTLAILITVIGFNLFGNGLREVLGGRSGGKPPG